MHMNLSTQQKMQQVMTLSPKMIQSMEILQLPLMALNERIEQELADNVVLEAQDRSSTSSDTEIRQTSEQARQEALERPIEQKEMTTDQNNESDFERLSEISAEWPEDNYTSGTRASSGHLSDLADQNHDAMANMLARPKSIQEHLLEQFRLTSCPPHLKDFGEYLIQNFDDNGRLQSSLPEVIQVYGLPISQEDAMETLGLIQTLDPPGVGARDIKECLLLQLQPETPYREVLMTLIGSHLEDLGRNRLPAIQRKTGYSLDLIKEAMEELRHLEPFPGRSFESNPVQQVTADMSVEKDANGKYQVKLEDEYIPSLRISRRYQHLMQKGNADGQTKEYIKKKIESAKWLIDAVEQRQNTLKNVAQAIVDHQTDFLDKGPEYIAPLKMQQIADVVGVHVTTVSRAVDDKWIQTSRGLIPLKRFFGGGTQTDDGAEVAWDVIRQKMQEIIDNEDKSKPLSDEALVEELAKHGYKLARRTVSKYRKVMGIGTSQQRREY